MEEKLVTSSNVESLLPDFIREDSPQFTNLLKYYYESLERSSYPLDVIYNLTNYYDLDSYTPDKLISKTTLIKNTEKIDSELVVSSTRGFPEEKGSILIQNEIVLYDYRTLSPQIKFIPNITPERVKSRFVVLDEITDQFDGQQTIFDLKLLGKKVFVPTSNHILINLGDSYLTPGVDYVTNNEDNSVPVGSVQFLTAPDESTSNIANLCIIEFLQGYVTETSKILDTVTTTSPKKVFDLKFEGSPYQPIADGYLLVFKNGNLLSLNSEYSLTDTRIIFKNNIVPSDNIFFLSIESQVPRIGTGASAYSIIDHNGQLDSIVVENNGSGYEYDETPKVEIYAETGDLATAYPLINGIRKVLVVEPGYGYDKDNPPSLSFNLTNVGNIKTSVTVKNESVTKVTVLNSGFNIDIEPKVTVIDPKMPVFGTIIIEETGNTGTGYTITGVEILDGGFGLTNGPKLYVDAPPFGEDKKVNRPQTATIVPIIENGQVVDVDIINGGLGFDPENPPRVKSINYRTAEVLDVKVTDGSITEISLLSGGHGYLETPTVYIVDNRYDAEGVYIGGIGAKARAILFNNSITDIIIEDFGSGYSDSNPPSVYISSPKNAQVVAEIGKGQITGFEVVERGFGYLKASFINCSRGTSGLKGFDKNENTIYVNTLPECHPAGTTVYNQNSEYLKYFLRRIKSQFLPEFPDIDFEQYDIRNLIKKIKNFYSIKGTKSSIESFFQTIFDDAVDISYPKDQIVRSSDALWSIDTIMRVELLKGNIEDILGNIIIQNASDVDPEVIYSSSIVDAYSILQTSKKTLYELVLDTNSYEGEFKVSYTTKLSESIDRLDTTITVDSTVGWPETNGYFYISNELVTYKSKSLNQFFECTRAANGVSRFASGGSKVSTNFYIYYNQGQPDEVVMKILGISKTESTVVDNPASNYLEGDVLSLSDLGTDVITNVPGKNFPLVNSWIFNVKKIQDVVLIQVKQKAGKYVGEVLLDKNHNLIRGQSIEIFGASPAIYNGSFTVENLSSTNAKTFDYNLNITEDQFNSLISTFPSAVGDIYLSIPLEKGKSDFRPIERIISESTADVQNCYLTDDYVYVASSGVPSYPIGLTGGERGFLGNSLLPGNQRYLKKFPKQTQVVSEKKVTEYGQLGLFLNGVPLYNYKSDKKIKFGSISRINVLNSGSDYDVEFDPEINVYKTIQTITGLQQIKNPEGVSLKPIVNGSLREIVVLNGGSGYTEPPILTVSGGGGTGAFATAVLSGGRISRVVVDSPGSGYFLKPVINIVGGGAGSGAVLDAVVRGPISSIRIDNPGQGFQENPDIEITTGSGGRAQAIILNGKVRSIGVLSVGSNYTTPPLVVITDKKGKNASAKAIIYTSGVNKGSIERIEVLNGGSGYNKDTVKVEIISIGNGASFSSEIFEWTFNINTQLEGKFDPKDGYVFIGKNNQFGSEYAHTKNPRFLRYLLGDSVLYNEVLNTITELPIQQVTRHSPIIGWAFDGNPIYGPYGFANPATNPGTNTNFIPMKSGWKLKNDRLNGPSTTTYPLGSFVEDYEYSLTTGVTLDRYNGRFCKTPEFPEGVYAYFVTITGTVSSIAEFPYVVGNEFYSVPDQFNFQANALQSNLPKDVIRYRTPYESTDIDVVRKSSDINSSLSTEDNSFNFILEDSQIITGYDQDGNPIYTTLEGYDINDDTFITDDELNPIEFIEESDIEIYNYFPTTEGDAKVDIRISNVNKFETSILEGFTIENGGRNFKVNDTLIFDTSESGGNLPSAKVSSVTGENVSELTFVFEGKKPYAKLTTTTDHGLTYNDKFKVETQPEAESQIQYQPNSYKVKVVNGIERIDVISFGADYDPETQINYRFFNRVLDNIKDVELNSIVDVGGSLKFIEVKNSGSMGLDVSEVKLSLDPPTNVTRTVFYNKKIKNDRTAELELPAGSLENLEKDQIISNDIVLDTNEIQSVTSANISGNNYKVTITTVDSNLITSGKKVLVSGFNNYTSLNGLKTVTDTTGNSFSYTVTQAGLPSTIEVVSKDWDQISSSQSGAHTLAIKQDKSLWAWGQNSFGQLGTGNRTRRKVPFKVSSSQWIAISANGNKSLAIKYVDNNSYGTLWAWGQNSFGELGINSTDPYKTSPVQIGTSNWKKVSSGVNHALAIMSDGTLWAWGRNSFGQLGIGSTTDYSYPVQVSTDTNWTEVHAGSSISAAINSSGKLFVWGDSRNSCLGLGKIASIRILNPGRSGTFTAESTVNFELSGASGKVVSWNPTTRLLILKNFTYTNVPTRDEKLYIGSDVSTSVNYGRLRSIVIHELDDFGSSLEFILTQGTGVFSTGETITSSRGVTATVVSYDSSTKKMKISNRSGEFIRNDIVTGNSSGAKQTFNRYTPQSGTRILVPTLINDSTWTKASSSNRSTFAIKDNGTLWSWGDNFFGNLGTGDLFDRNIPTQIGTSTTWSDVSAGSYHVLGINDSDLYAWGRASSYELGNGSLDTKLAPVEITGITDIGIIEAGNSSSFIIKDMSGTDAPLLVFGNATQGRLGNNKIKGLVSTPTEIQSISVILNPESTIVESSIFAINSTNSIVEVSNIVNSSGQYPNNSEYLDDDIIEVVKDNDELIIDQKITQVLTNNVLPFSSSIRLNNLNNVEIGKLIRVVSEEKSFNATVKDINSVLTLTEVPSSTEIYAGNKITFPVNNNATPPVAVVREFLVTGVSKKGSVTLSISQYTGNDTNIVTATVSSTAGISVGDELYIFGSTADTNLNGTWNIIAVPNSTTFKFGITSPLATGSYLSGLGTAIKSISGTTTLNVSLDMPVSEYQNTSTINGNLDAQVAVTIPSYSLFDEDMIVVSDIDSQSNSIFVRTLITGKSKTTSNPISLSDVSISMYSVTLEGDQNEYDFGNYNSTFFVENTFSNQQSVKYIASNTSTPINGLTSGNIYYIKNVTRYSFSLSAEVDDVETITVTTIPSTSIHRFRSVIRRKIQNSSYAQNKINYTTTSIDKNENLYAFGSTFDSQGTKCITFHKFDNSGELKFESYLLIPEAERGSGITQGTFQITASKSFIKNNDLYLLVETVYRQISSTLVKDLIIIKYDISSEQPLKLSTSVLLSSGSYAISPIGIFVEEFENREINIISNILNHPGSEDKESILLLKVTEDQPTNINTLSFTSTNTSVKLNNALTNSNTIFLSNTFYENQPVVYTSFLPIGGLESNTVYYIINNDNEKFKLAKTPSGAPVQLTSLGDNLLNAHTISPVLIPSYDISLQRRISFDNELSIDDIAYQQISVSAKSFDVNESNFVISSTSNNKPYLIKINKSTFSVDLIKEVSGITSSLNKHFIKFNQFNEIYFAFNKQIVRLDINGNVIKQVTIPSYTSNHEVSSLFFDYFDNVIVILNDNSGNNSKVVVNYFDYKLDYLKTQTISESDVNILVSSSVLDLYNSIYFTITESTNNFYSYIYRTYKELQNNTSNDITMSNSTSLITESKLDNFTISFTDNSNIIGRQGTQFSNFSITDINIFDTDCPKSYQLSSTFADIFSEKVSTKGSKPVFDITLNKKYYIEKDAIQFISPVVTYQLNKTVNYPIGSTVVFTDNEILSNTYSGVILDKGIQTLTVTEFSSSNPSLIQNILDNSNVKLKNENPFYNSKINNTFVNSEKIEAKLQISNITADSVFLPGDTVEFLTPATGNTFVYRGKATILFYNETTNVISFKNVFDDGISESTRVRITKTIGGENTVTAFAEFLYATDWDYVDKFEFEIPSEYEDDYIFESDNITNGSIVSIKVVNSGTDYTVAPSVIVQNQPGVNGSGLIAIAILNANGGVDRILVENGGAKFTKTPNIILLGGDGQGATAKVTRMRFVSEVYTIQVIDREQNLDLTSSTSYDDVELGDVITQTSTSASGIVVSKNRDLIRVKLSNQSRFDTSAVSISGVRTESTYSATNVGITSVSPCVFFSGESTTMKSVLDEYDGNYVNQFYPQLTVNSNDIISISRLYGVSKINLITRLFEYVYQISGEDLVHEDKIFIKTTDDHNLRENSLASLILPPTYSQINLVDQILSENEFIFRLYNIDLNNLPHNKFNSSTSELYYKTPSFNMVYGHSYRFDVSDFSNTGTLLNFSRDDSNRVVYTFNNVVRNNIVPGQVGSFVDFVVESNAGQLSYYFNEANSDGNNFVLPDSTISLRETPYNGTFRVHRVLNDTQLLYPLPYKPECDAFVLSGNENTTKYLSYSETSSGSISEISIFNNGGYFKVLPRVSEILCPRKIEKIEILNGGTEYEPGIYRDVPISGDGVGGLVDITVTPEIIINDLDEEIITGRITQAVVINPGERYTEATINIVDIPGILGSASNGSGGQLQVVIPPPGTGSSVLPYSEKVGSIRKLSNLNVGFDYTHDYTLKPQIKFPISLQLVNAKVISEILIDDPGFGYTSTPIILIEGGGGSGAAAVATVKNNRVSGIELVSAGSGYFSEPNIIIQSKIPYVVNLDLNLIQFKVPHGIPNASTIKLRADVVDGNNNVILPIVNYPGGMNNLIDPDNSVTGAYQTTLSLSAIVGESNGLLPNQLRIAINKNEALLNNYLNFITTGSPTQFLLTEVFGAKARSVLKSSQFLGNEVINQLESQIVNGVEQEVITCVSKVLPNSGWISGPNILRLNVLEGEFGIGKKVVGLSSESSGIINKIISASGFGEIGSTSTIDGKFYEETGKLSSISQRLQSEYYQNFAYLIKTTTPSEDWRNLVLDNLHPIGFSLFSEYSYETNSSLPKLKASTAFSRDISVDAAQRRGSRIFSPGYVEDVLNLNEVSVVGKKLITSENIITSFVEKIVNISDNFDGATTTFDLQVKRLITNLDGSTTEVIDAVRSNERFLMIFLNNTLQSPDSYVFSNGQITFDEAPSARLVSKSRNVKFTNLYPPVGKFVQDEKLYVVRVKEFNIDGINIWQQTVIIQSSTNPNIKIGDTVKQSDINGVITEIGVVFENSIYTVTLVVVFTTTDETIISPERDLKVFYNNEDLIGTTFDVTYVSTNQIADLRPFKFDILEGSEVVNDKVDIFSYQNLEQEREYSVNISAYKINDNLNQLSEDARIIIRLFDFEFNQYKVDETSNYVTLSNDELGPFILSSNASTISPSDSKTDLAYDVNETNLSIRSIFTFDSFLNYNQSTPSLVELNVGDVLTSTVSKGLATVVSVNEVTKEVEVSIKSNINNPFINENETLQSRTTQGEIIEGNLTNFVFFTTQNAKYKVTKIRFKSDDDNTFTDDNTPLPVVLTNDLLISKTYGTANNQDSSSIFLSLNDLVVGEKSRASCKITEITRINNINEVEISPGTLFTGYIFNRVNNPDNPNVSLTDISKSYIVPFNKLESYGSLYYKEIESSRLLLDDYLYNESIGDRFKSIQLDVEYGNSYEFNVNDTLEIVRVSVDVEEAGSRFRDGSNLIKANRQEIVDRAAAEIAIQFPDFSYPGDPITTAVSRFKDAYRLIQLNRTAIIDTAFAAIAPAFPTFVINATNTDKCKRDIGIFVDSISLDIAQAGGNVYTRKFVLSYFNSNTPITNGLVGEEAQSNVAFNAACEEMKKAVTNQLAITDLTITPGAATFGGGGGTIPNNSVNACADVRSALDSLTLIVTTRIAAGNITGLPAESVSTTVPAGEAKCKRDIGIIVDAVVEDLFRGSNVNIIESTNAYFNNGTPISNGLVNEEAQSVVAFNKARDVMKLAINNQLFVKDLTIQGDYQVSFSNTDPDGCANVRAMIDTLISIITTTITAADPDLLPDPNPGRAFVAGELVTISDGTTTYESNVLSSDNVNYIISLENIYQNDQIVINTELLDLTGYTVSTNRGASNIEIVAPVKDLDVTRTTVKSRTYDITTKFTLNSITGLSVGLTATQGSIVGKVVDIIANDIYINHASYDTENHYVTGNIVFNTIPAITKSVTANPANRETIYYISTSEIVPQINKYQPTPGTIHSYTPWNDLYDVLDNNRSFIIDYVYELIITEFAYLSNKNTITIGSCKNDLALVLNAIINDIKLGGNYNTVLATRLYFDSNNEVNFLKGEVEESIWSYSRLKDFIKLSSRNFEVVHTCNLVNTQNYIVVSDPTGIVRGMLVTTDQFNVDIYVKYVSGNKVYLMTESFTDYILVGNYSAQEVTFNFDKFKVNPQFVSVLYNVPIQYSSDVTSSTILDQNISDLVDVLLNAINPDSLRVYKDAVIELLETYEDVIDDVYNDLKVQFDNLTIPNDNLDKCQRDMKVVSESVFDDLKFGGNVNTIRTSELYVNGGSLSHVETELIETAYAFFKLEISYKEIINNSTNYTTQEKTDIQERITELFQLLISKITNDATGTVQDAAAQIARNERFIVDEAFLITLDTQPTAFSQSEITQLYSYAYSVVKSTIKNLLLGSNEYVLDALTALGATSSFYSNSSKKSFVQNFFTRVISLSKLSTINFYINAAEDQYVVQESVLTYKTDLTISVDPAGWSYCQSVHNTLDTFGIIINNYWTNLSLPDVSIVEFTYFPKRLYPENYVQRPITSSISENDLCILKSSTLTKTAFVNAIDSGITKIYDLQKRFDLDDEDGTIEKSNLVGSFVNTSISVTLKDINDNGSVNVSITGNGSNISVGQTFTQDNGFSSIIESIYNVYILKNVYGNFYKNNYIFGIDSGSTSNSYISSFERNTAVIEKSIGDRLIFDSTSVVGSFTLYDYVYVKDTTYESNVVYTYQGFNGQRTQFPLIVISPTGDIQDYYPSVEDSPIIVSINGVIQEFDNDYTTSSNFITFDNPPTKDDECLAVYYGKWRKIDNISPQFDGITQSFGMEIGGLPFAISVFGNATNIIVDRNCLFTVNGVVQVPQEGFTVDGSRIRFSSAPKPGSSFVGYVYVGSAIDVDSIEVIPQIEPTDIIRLNKEDTNRIVATVDSLSSVTTFEYPGEKIGRIAAGTATIRTGKIIGASLTSGGSGYIRRPKIKINSSSGDEAKLTAQLGVSNVEVINAGSGYLKPSVQVISTTGTGFTGEILFEPDSNNTQRISVIKIINSGFGYSSTDEVSISNVGNPEIPVEFKVVVNEAGGIENIYPVLIGIIEINEGDWDEQLFDQYTEDNFKFRIRGATSKSEAVFVGGGESEAKIFVKDITGSFVPGENINIVSFANNVSLGKLTSVESFYLNVGGSGYNPLRLKVTYTGEGTIPTGGFVEVGTQIQYQFDTFSKLSDSNFIINIDKSYSYVEGRDFHIGEKIDVYARSNGVKTGTVKHFVVESWNPTTLKLTVSKPTPIKVDIVLNENGSVTNAIVINKGNNYYDVLNYAVTLEGQTETGYDEASFELSIASVTDIIVTPYTIGNESYDGFGRDYSTSDTVLIQPIDEFGETENVVGSGSGATIKLNVNAFGGEIESITIPDNLRGSQYYTTPIIVTKGGGGYGVKALASIENNLVSDVEFVSRGVGFESVPEIIFAQKVLLTKESKIRTYLTSKTDKLTGLVKNVIEDDTQIFVSSTGGFTSSGTLLLGKEVISYSGKTANSFTGITRGINFNYDQKLRLSSGFWNFSINDILPIIRVNSEESGSITTNIRVYSFEPQSQDEVIPPFLFIKYVIDSLAFIDAGVARSEGTPSYVGGLFNTSPNGNYIINAQSLHLNNVDGLSEGDIVEQTIVVDQNTTIVISGSIVRIIKASNRIVVELDDDNTEFVLGQLIINPDEPDKTKTRFITTPFGGIAVEKMGINRFDTTKISDGPTDTDLDLIKDKTYVICQSDSSVCNSLYPQLKGYYLLDPSIIEESGFLITDSIYPRNLTVGGAQPYGYISTVEKGPNNKGLTYSGVNNTSSDYNGEIALDGGYPFSLYGVEEIDQLGNTIAIGDKLRDGNGNIVTVETISAVNTGEVHQSQVTIKVNKPTTYGELLIGRKVQGAVSGFSGIIKSVNIPTGENYIELVLVNLLYNDPYYGFIIQYQQGEIINIYNGNVLIVENKYTIQSYEFNNVLLSQ